MLLMQEQHAELLVAVCELNFQPLQLGHQHHQPYVGAMLSMQLLRQPDSPAVRSAGVRWLSEHRRRSVNRSAAVSVATHSLIQQSAARLNLLIHTLLHRYSNTYVI